MAEPPLPEERSCRLQVRSKIIPLPSPRPPALLARQQVGASALIHG
jgi:hypothetical protein